MKKAKNVEAIMRSLARAIDGLDLPAVEKISEVQQEDPFQILIATILSARTQDATTLAASTRLFRVARTPRTMARLTVKQIERLIYPVSFYRHKAKHVKATCRMLVERFGGRVPGTMEELLLLPGVGRKTANLVLILGFRSLRNICVDTHVHRISNRLGWVRTRTPDETEQALYRGTASRWWPYINLYLVTWGQNVCRPIAPRCGECVLRPLCPRVGVVISAIFLALLAATGPAAAQSSAPPTIVIETNRGTFSLTTFPTEAPITVKHVVELVKRGFYDGQRIHRAIPGFIVQFGDPQSRDPTRRDLWGRGAGAASGKPVGVVEMSKKRLHVKGAVGLSHPGTPAQADSQIYVTLATRPDLDGQYVVFGQVTSGDAVPAMLQVGDVIVRMAVMP